MKDEYQLLRIPGPTPIPPSVQQAMMKPMIGHRDHTTKALLKRIKPSLRHIFGTKEDVMIVAGSGTAGLEAAVVNTISPGDEVLVIVTGSFGERFAKICESYNMNVHRYEYDWGKAFLPEEIKSYLKKHPSIKAVFATYCETSTGVLNPVRELASVVREVSDALIIVDGVSAIGATPMMMDDWGIDICVTGSQKALMLPPGLTFIAVSQKAWNRIEKNHHSRFYLDLRRYRTNLIEDSTPFTPALSLLFGLEQSLNLLKLEGLENVYNRHQMMKKMTRAAFKALGIPLLTNDTDASPTVTAIQPRDFNPDQFRNIVKEEFGLILAGGQNHLKGKIFRIGHLGYCTPQDVLQTISCIEIGIQRIGKNIPLGDGVRAAQELYIKEG
ncbi:pyridoxal-phosphate-dependent aminotransferase family protein [Ornithinibacillus halotolerans]|uniref:Class V aminotransferase n=1 Tax=Ornithinibacillus halotolerans TaxID=1274357 RepID=A0A916S621_9BACI|nr:alanine--glyoxylate aminotransferase family protein [Ornithinibacillus halotolerans]GGA85324.1 class V aminotransferase [Ornithinibacillus halotolerans]